jgi:hypothetical protein
MQLAFGSGQFLYPSYGGGRNFGGGEDVRIDQVEYLTAAPERRDAFVAVTSPTSVRTTKRLFGTYGNSFISEFAQMVGSPGAQALQVPTYITALMPSPASMPGGVIYVTDATAGQRLQISDGIAWRLYLDSTLAAPLASPALTGSPTVPTQTARDGSTKIASTAYVDGAVNGRGAPNTQTGTTYTLVLADAGKSVEMNNAGAMTLTVPPNSSAAFPIGTEIKITRLGAGTLTIAQGAGVTLPNKVEAAGTTNRTVTAQYGVATLTKRATDQWVLSGDIA